MDRDEVTDRPTIRRPPIQKEPRAIPSIVKREATAVPPKRPSAPAITIPARVDVPLARVPKASIAPAVTPAAKAQVATAPWPRIETIPPARATTQSRPIAIERPTEPRIAVEPKTEPRAALEPKTEPRAALPVVEPRPQPRIVQPIQPVLMPVETVAPQPVKRIVREPAPLPPPDDLTPIPAPLPLSIAPPLVTPAATPRAIAAEPPPALAPTVEQPREPVEAPEPPRKRRAPRAPIVSTVVVGGGMLAAHGKRKPPAFTAPVEPDLLAPRAFGASMLRANGATTRSRATGPLIAAVLLAMVAVGLGVAYFVTA